MLQTRTLTPPGLHVHGQLLGAPPRPGHKDQIRTYFQIITVTTVKPRAYTVNITRSSISVRDKGTLFLSWDRPALLRRSYMELHVAAAAHLTLRFGPHLEFLVLRHRYRHPSALQLPHLGFYVVNGSGLSPLAHGLLGKCCWGWEGPGSTPVPRETLPGWKASEHPAPCSPPRTTKRNQKQGLPLGSCWPG